MDAHRKVCWSGSNRRKGFVLDCRLATPTTGDVSQSSDAGGGGGAGGGGSGGGKGDGGGGSGGE